MCDTAAGASGQSGRSECLEQDGAVALLLVPRDPPERGQGLLVAAGVEEGAPQVEPVGLGMVRVEPHRLPDPALGLFRLAGEHQDRPHRADGAVVVGVQEEGALLVLAGSRQVVALDEDLGQDAMALALVFVELEAPFGRRLGPVEEVPGIGFGSGSVSLGSEFPDWRGSSPGPFGSSPRHRAGER